VTIVLWAGEDGPEWTSLPHDGISYHFERMTLEEAMATARQRRDHAEDVYRLQRLGRAKS
jgi:hypothetical protein